MHKFGIHVENTTSRYNFLAYFVQNICQKNILKAQRKEGKRKKTEKENEREYHVSQNVKEKK